MPTVVVQVAGTTAVLGLGLAVLIWSRDRPALNLLGVGLIVIWLGVGPVEWVRLVLMEMELHRRSGLTPMSNLRQWRRSWDNRLAVLAGAKIAVALIGVLIVIAAILDIAEIVSLSWLSRSR